MREALPAPATQVDMYLHDIALSLRQLNDALAQIAAASDEAAAATAGNGGNAEDGPWVAEDAMLTPLREKAPPKRRKQ